MASPDTVPARLLGFGAFELDLEACALRKSGRRIAMTLQPLSVLAALVARPGEVITREELRRELWGDGTNVELDARLDRCLSVLRRVLGDSARAPCLVGTVRRRGYRLLVPVLRVSSPAPPVAAAPSVPPPRARPMARGPSLGPQ